MMESMEQYILDTFDAAVREERIQVYYQPVIRTLSRQLCSLEALARWNDPRHGVIAPDRFIGVLEANRLIHRLDACVIRQVCARIRRSMDGESMPIPISINLSRLDFELCDIFAVVEASVTEYRIPRSYLYIEITESMIADNEARMMEVIGRFREAGYQVWMDDFGSGYSSLNVLKDFDFDELKIDMRFLSAFNLKTRKILASVVNMAKDIGMHTLTEGVETEEQFRFLRDIGCEKVQGYLFGRPMPYEDILARLRQEGVAVEHPRERIYHDELGMTNVLSAAPFAPRGALNSPDTARELNSIPLAIFEMRGERFCLLFYNAAFERISMPADWDSRLFSESMLGVYMSTNLLPTRVANLLEEVRGQGDGRLFLSANEEYFELRGRLLSECRDAYSVLVQLTNLSRSAELIRTNALDESLRQIYSIFDRVAMIDLAAGSVSQLYAGAREDMISAEGGIRERQAAFAERWVFEEDREGFLRFMDPNTVERRIVRSRRGYLSGYFRTYSHHGQFIWKQYLLVRMRPGAILEIARDAEAEIQSFRTRLSLEYRQPDGAEGLSGELLWKNLVRSNVARVFWKDASRRFLGASKAFLDYYGFAGAEEILGKTDEDLGWHIHPDPFMNDEWRVIREGVSTNDVSGKCIARGENRDIVASKAPLYDDDGRIVGLIGCFTDKTLAGGRELKNYESTRRDPLTDLLNSRGLSEEAHAYQDEYFRRDVDFARVHVSIDDFAAINSQYGFDHGDKVIAALGRALKELVGRNASVGRVSGYQFVMLRQISAPDDMQTLTAAIKGLSGRIREVDGIPCTLYLSVGYAAFSETEEIAAQMQQAETRMIVDHGEHAPNAYKASRNSEIFRMYDQLPVSYAAYKVRTDGRGEVADAEVVYVNRLFERRAGRKAEDMIGRGVRKLWPELDAAWFDKARRAALLGEDVIETMYFKPTDMYYYTTASQVIGPGLCAFTYQEMRGDPGAEADYLNIDSGR